MVAAVLSLFLFLPKNLPASRRLGLHYSVLVTVAFLSGSVFLFRERAVFKPVVKVWAPAKSKTVGPARATLQINETNLPVGADLVFLFTLGLGAGAVGLGIFFLIHAKMRIARLLRGSYLIKSYGRVEVRVAPGLRIPFAYRTFLKCYAVLPEYILAQPKLARLSVAHEFQHHRQGDTAWAYVFGLLRAACFFNPFVHFWISWIGETQEFACDEAVIGHHQNLSRDYARGLIQVAETALAHEALPTVATGMLFWGQGHLLNRRIKNMFTEKQHRGGATGLAAFALIAVMLTGTAFAAKGLVQDRRVSLKQAQDWAIQARKGSEFPIVVNEEVLKHLNNFVGTAEGRAKIRVALQRMEGYRPMIQGKIDDYGAPIELMAIPIIESWYQNLEDRNAVGYGAGLWMFIVSTARAYGLRVDSQVDERLNVTLETDAAMRYLGANNLRFSDWQLSVLAYNAGENKVQEVINELGTRDPWALVRRSSLSQETKNYLPKLMAAILIMKNPSVFE